MERHLSIGACLLAALLLAGCDLEGGPGQVSQDFHSTYNLSAGSHLDLTNTNGSVEVTGWDRASIDVSGTKYAHSQDILDRIKVNVDVSGGTARIRTEVPKGDWVHGGGGVHYRIRVPRQITVDQLETTNGAITAENLEGGGRVNSTNGRLLLTRLTGDYRARTSNGAIDLEECSGNEVAETTNGSIRGHLRAGSIQAHSSNGSVDLSLDEPTARKPMEITTTNGGLTFSMAQYRENPIKAETTHGGVTLRLPADTNAQLNAETSMANITNELPMTSTDENSKHHLRGVVGRGGPEILASSSMGHIRIGRY